MAAPTVVATSTAVATSPLLLDQRRLDAVISILNDEQITHGGLWYAFNSLSGSLFLPQLCSVRP
ncbi:MAG: hypothetical protein AAFX78_18775 [Cyanobacteria bacterium J06638_20]